MFDKISILLKVSWPFLTALHLHVGKRSQEQPYNIMSGGTYTFLI